MEENVNLKLNLDVGEAEQGLERINQGIKDVQTNLENAATGAENLGKGLEGASDKAEELNKKTGETATNVDKAVGSLAGLDKAFEKVFNSVVKEGGKAAGVTGGIFKTIKEAIPAVKTLNATAISGLKGVKKAIAATGIGALLIAITTLTTHWEGFLHAVGSSKEEFSEFLGKAVDVVGKVVSAIVGAGNVVVQFLLTPIRQTISAFSTLGKVAKAIFKGDFKQAVEEAKTGIKNLYDTFKKGFDVKDSYQKGKEAGEKFVKAVETTFTYKAPDAEKAGNKFGTKLGKSIEEAFQKELQKSEKALQKSIEELKEYVGDAEAVLEKMAKNKENYLSSKTQSWFENLLKPENPRATTEEVVAHLETAYKEINAAIARENEKIREKNLEIQTWNIQHPDDRKELIDYLESVQLTYETYLGLLAGDAQVYANEINSMISERHRMLATGRTTLAEDLEKELEIQKKAYSNEEALLTKRRNFLLENGITGPEVEDITAELQVLADKRITFIREQSRKIADAILDTKLEALQVQEDIIRKDLSTPWSSADFLEIYDQRLQAMQEYYAKMRDTFTEGTTEYEKYAVKYEEVTARLNGTDAERTQAMFAYLDQQVGVWNDMLQSIGNMFGAAGDAYEAYIQRQQKLGKIGEKDAKEMYKRAQNLRLAEVAINTISGAAGAFLQASAAYPPPYGQIIGAATATTVAASGLAQWYKIKNTDYSNPSLDGGGGGGNVPSVGVTPIQVTDDIQPSPSVMGQSQSPVDQRVYILQSDLEESHRQVEVREANSSF